jgi:hypothetical protein
VSTRVVRLLAGLAVTMLLVGCGTTATPAPGATPTATPAPAATRLAGPVTVTLGIYSGRADPAWTLTEAEAASLDAALAILTATTGTPPVGGLGYHGFTIERLNSVLVAFRGAVASPGEGTRTYLADPARTIERLLAGTARGHVTAVELAEVAKALGAP